MGYMTIIIALGIIVLFGYWSGSRRTKSQKSRKSKVSEVYPLKRQTKLRRIK